MSTEAVDLYKAMLTSEDVSVIADCLRKKGHSSTDKRSGELIHAFFQWFAAAKFASPKSTFVMLKSAVDEVFHCYLDNVELYKELCRRYMGFEIRHHPIGELGIPDEELKNSALETISTLERFYGDDLHPELKAWRYQINNDIFVVSCVKGCPDDDDNKANSHDIYGGQGKASRMGATVIGDMGSGARLLH